MTDLNKAKRIVILMPMVWSIRNIVTSNLIAKLVDNEVEVVLLVHKNHGFEKILSEYTHNVRFEEIIPSHSSNKVPGEHALSTIQKAAMRYFLGNYFFHRRLDELRGAEVLTYDRVINQLGVVLRWRISRQLIANMHDWVYRKNHDITPVLKQLSRINPDVLLSTVCVDKNEHSYIKAAKTLGKSTATLVLSFDNLTSRGGIPRFDRYMAWSDRMKRRILTLFPDINPDSVTVTGTPQFDFHRKEEFKWTRSETLNKLKIPTDSRYILYAANSEVWAPNEPDFVLELSRQLADCKNLKKFKILTRLHPLDDVARWDYVRKSSPNVVISSSWWSVAPDENGWAVIGTEDQSFLVSTILHSDLCINMCSTMSLDAAILNKPVICRRFANVPNSMEDLIARHSYSSLHYAPLVASGGISLADTWEELIRLIQESISTPESLKELREEMVLAECGIVDGRSTENVTAVLMDMLD